YDPIAIDVEALQTIGWSNPEQFLVPASAQGKPPPELMDGDAIAEAVTREPEPLGSLVEEGTLAAV
ncbi:MAG: hypothetical protein EBT21_04730, partial [Actinobacteria bacterium]|nr:hypothetical protein [Actinomycetota bacterium]